MRPAQHASLLGVALLAMVAASAAQQVFTNREEYNRKKAEYDLQKAKYDEYQSIANVPVLAGYDLIAKGEPGPGTAEQLLPIYDGKTIDFKGTQTPFFNAGSPTGKTVFTADEPAPEPAPTPASAASGSALFFGRGALPSQPVELKAAAPVTASAQFAPFRSFEGSSSAANFALKREQQAQVQGPRVSWQPAVRSRQFVTASRFASSQGTLSPQPWSQ